ncbi:MAG: restriction endonuclease subunit S [Synechococcus sp. SB0669_bin_8]|nr:restriction endonuclease subunit S [Synechococcus sp. SB0669_bin_8]
MLMYLSNKPYPAYKDSGVEWLGKVPEHWKVRRLKNWLGINRRVLPEDTDPEYTFQYVDIGSVSTGRLTETPKRLRFGNTPSRARRIVAHGDTIVSTVRTYLKAVWYADNLQEPLIASTGFAVLTPDKNTLPKFVSYICESNPFTDLVTSESVGIAYPAIAETRLGTFSVCIPPLPEQGAIAHFLDHATQRIQHHIQAKQKLIKLLEEQKQVIIHQAVTGQLNVQTGQPYPAYKDSGVEWLGKVPEHWEMRRLKYIVSFTGGGTPSKANASFWSGPIPWVSPKDMNRARLDDTADHISREAVAASAASIVAPGAVLLVVRSGILSRTIPVAINTVSMALNQDMKALRPRNGIIKSEYLHGLIEGNQAFLLREWTKQGATVESIEHHLLANSLIPIPSLPEQTAITRFLGHTNHRISKHHTAVKREIDLLHEYRTRLIADVVTGKLDVREAAAHLPESDPPALAATCQDGTELAARSRSPRP